MSLFYLKINPIFHYYIVFFFFLYLYKSIYLDWDKISNLSYSLISLRLKLSFCILLGLESELELKKQKKD